MKKSHIIFFTIIALAVVVVLFPDLPGLIQFLLIGSVGIPIITYNSLIAKKNNVSKAKSSIDVMLKKRFDLIPNLVSSVKVYMYHEKALLAELSALQNQLSDAQLSLESRMEIENQLSRTISGLMIVVENTPELSANAQFLKLQGSLNEAEEQISAARRAFNAAVTEYNNGLEMVPSNIVAAFMNLEHQQVFEARKLERENVDVGKVFDL